MAGVEMKALFGGIKKIPFGRLCVCDAQTLLFATDIKKATITKRKAFIAVDATGLCTGRDLMFGV